jgi:hypothetical protein
MNDRGLNRYDLLVTIIIIIFAVFIIKSLM